MKTRFALLVLVMLSFSALAAKPKQPQVECEVKAIVGNKRIEIVCKSKQALKPGDGLTIEININSNPNYPPEAV